MTSFSILLPFLFFFFFFSSLTTAWVSTQSLFPSLSLLFYRLQRSEYTLTHAHELDMRQNSRRRWSLYSWGRRSDGSTGRTITFVFSGMLSFSFSFSSFLFCFVLLFVFYLSFFIFGLILTFASNRTFRARFRIMVVCLMWGD